MTSLHNLNTFISQNRNRLPINKKELYNLYSTYINEELEKNIYE